MSVITEQIAGFKTSALLEFSDRPPWELTGGAIGIVERLLSRLCAEHLGMRPTDYDRLRRMSLVRRT